MNWLLGGGLVGSLGVIGAVVAAAVWLVKRTLDAQDARRVAELATAELAADLRSATAAMDTTDRLRRLETARAAALEEELAHADQSHAATADPGARARVLARWRDASAEAAVPGPATGGGTGAVALPLPAAPDAKR